MPVGRTGRIGSAVTGFAFVLALAGCAQPGQLGRPAPATTAAPGAPVAPAAAAPAGPQTVGRGVVDVPLRFRTPADAAYTVRTLDLAPGEALGWETHPGTELTLLDAGEVTVQEADACAPRVLAPGQVAVVGEGVAHVVRNTGTGPARLVVTSFLAQRVPEATPVPSPCPGEPAPAPAGPAS
ncbi:cupin domain-containing protein [Pseudonocardia sp. RS11V-5]|uniref:cupin domain-containing protein n=1 Tax=Pseudonocardia terrae TaxID=2905831 RepID=UPI001E49F7CF|nr:cupin domain-containing protein [Pseudonocardia terrae]MCE3550319.1 cupin domain-containing protein [Pseudonocardia terrae]